MQHKQFMCLYTFTRFTFWSLSLFGADRRLGLFIIEIMLSKLFICEYQLYIMIKFYLVDLKQRLTVYMQEIKLYA